MGDQSIMDKCVLTFLFVASTINIIPLAFGVSTTPTPTVTATVTAPNMETCQCGVFLLGTQPLVFSADAKPILNGEFLDFQNLFQILSI